MPASAGRAARIRVGVAGCGRIAPVHLSAPWPGADVVALADADPVNLDAAARLAPAAAQTADYRDLCTDPDIDAILVCLPSGLHAEAACLALTHGKAIYLEKPLATDLAQRKEVAEAWRRSGQPAMIGSASTAASTRSSSRCETGSATARSGTSSAFDPSSAHPPTRARDGSRRSRPAAVCCWTLRRITWTSRAS